jgi:hypothetical protein
MEFLEAEALARVLPGDCRQVLEQADRFTLFSLDPYSLVRDPDTGEGSYSCSGGRFHGFVVLGHTTVEDVNRRAELLHALYEGFAEVLRPRTGLPRVRPCYEPRHGLRASRGKRTVDLVVCFTCSPVQVYPDAASDSFSWHKVGASPRALFDQALTQAGIPLCPADL